MMTKRKNYTTIRKLKITERVTKGKSTASLFHESGTPKGIIHGWMKEENKLHSSVDVTEDDIQLQRNKT
jgi:hypothetical protein